MQYSFWQVKQKVTGILVLCSIQITKGTWHLREQYVPGYLSSFPSQEPGNEASLAPRLYVDTG